MVLGGRNDNTLNYILMKKIKRLIELIYFENNYKNRGAGEIIVIVGIFISLTMPFVGPILYAFFGQELMTYILLFIYLPILYLSLYLYFKKHHNEIMNNIEYINAKNRKKIYHIIAIICAFAWLPLMYLIIELLKVFKIII